MNGPGTGFGRTGDAPEDRPGGGGGGAGGVGPGGLGPGPGPGPGLDGTASGRPVEDRLRRAFAARAESIGIRDLRPAAPRDPPRAAAAARSAAALAAPFRAAAGGGRRGRRRRARLSGDRPRRPAGPAAARPATTLRRPVTGPDAHGTAHHAVAERVADGRPPHHRPVRLAAPTRPTRDAPTAPTTAQPSGRPDSRASGTNPPPSTPPSPTPTPEGGDRSTSPTASAS